MVGLHSRQRSHNCVLRPSQPAALAQLCAETCTAGGTVTTCVLRPARQAAQLQLVVSSTVTTVC